jgi:hypothetical protein
MKKIVIEIACGETICNECHKQYGDVCYEYFRYCNLFSVYLGDSREGEILRCQECKKLEVKSE